MKGVHSNCAILYSTLFFTYIADGIKAMIRPGSEDFHRFLPLMYSGLTGEQELAQVVGTVHVPSIPGIQEHVGRDGSSMIRSSRLTHHQLEAHRCTIRHSSLHCRGSHCSECQPIFTDIPRDNQKLYCARGIPIPDVVGCG